MDHFFVLSQSDGRPMYLQIMEHIKNRVATGDWGPGFKMPSIRELAVSTKVSVITIKRAYQELEREGVIITQPGKGSFVAAVSNLGEHIMQQKIDEHLLQALANAKLLKLELDDLIQRLKLLSEDEENHD